MEPEKKEYKEKDQEILNMDFVVVSYMIIGGEKQATQIYVGVDCPDKSYLNTMAIQLTNNLNAQLYKTPEIMSIFSHKKAIIRKEILVRLYIFSMKNNTKGNPDITDTTKEEIILS